MGHSKITIDTLIEIVNNGGVVKTGIDVYNNKGVLLLEKDVLVNKVKTLIAVKQNGVFDIPIDAKNAGGVWDKYGSKINIKIEDARDSGHAKVISEIPLSNIERKIQEINALKREASEKYQKAKNNIKKVITEIQKSGGEFDYTQVEETVTDLFTFITRKDSAFSYLTKEIFSYDDYLYNHSINVCTIGTAVLLKFNDHFGDIVNNYLKNFSVDSFNKHTNEYEQSFVYKLPEEIHDISVGFFLHDVGKVLIPDQILNKKGRLTETEFEIVKTHSYLKGMEILEKNNQNNPFIKNSIKYHHSSLFAEEQNCYPSNKLPIELPDYVKVCKLADIYDAMTSKRVYKDALNPVAVVTDIFRKYAEKDRMLQFILHSFVKTVGIYPPGSIVCTQNGQLVYVIDSSGPIVIPFTDTKGITLNSKPDPINLSKQTDPENGLQIDRRKSLISPIDAYDRLPNYLKEGIVKNG